MILACTAAAYSCAPLLPLLSLDFFCPSLCCTRERSAGLKMLDTMQGQGSREASVQEQKLWDEQTTMKLAICGHLGKVTEAQGNSNIQVTVIQTCGLALPCIRCRRVVCPGMKGPVCAIRTACWTVKSHLFENGLRGIQSILSFFKNSK